MAKRFTDSDKWRRSYWFRRLPPVMKLLWIYICDNCDQAGVWTEDLDLAGQDIGVTITCGEFMSHFGDKFFRIDDHRIFFPAFIGFQYGKLSEGCKPHQSIIKILRKYGIDPNELTLCEGYPKGIQTLEETEKEQEKEKEKEEGECEGKQIPASTQPTQIQPDAKDLSLQIDQCCGVWKETLRKFNMGRTLLPQERVMIGRAIQHYGAKAVELALIGARHQKRDEKYDPANWVNLMRYLDPKNFQTLLNLGTKAVHEAQGVA